MVSSSQPPPEKRAGGYIADLLYSISTKQAQEEQEQHRKPINQPVERIEVLT
jgi:hypothetical protein